MLFDLHFPLVKAAYFCIRALEAQRPSPKIYYLCDIDQIINYHGYVDLLYSVNLTRAFECYYILVIE